MNSHVFNAQIDREHFTDVLAFFCRRMCMIENNYHALKEATLNETIKGLLRQRYFGTILLKSPYHTNFLASYLTRLYYEIRKNAICFQLKHLRYLT